MRALLLMGLLAAVAGAAPATAGSTLAAAFGARSYRPGQVAVLHVFSSPTRQMTLEVFQVGAGNDDRAVAGLAVVPARRVSGSDVHIGLGDWPSGVYVARLVATDGAHTYAPFVLRPRILGRTRVLVVEPTNTWEAYDFWGGDSWYENPSVHVVDLGRPYLDGGLPPHDALGVGFLRWLAASGNEADVVSDDDLERFGSGGQLRRAYDLIVFPGHEEYVTEHVYDIVEGFRDRGGNLAFLSADNFFYRVYRDGDAIVGRTRWRDLGRPEAALVGAEYVGWDERRFPNLPYRVASVRAAPWLWRGSGLRYGSPFGRYGIEIDEKTAASPPGTEVLAEIPDDFGPGLAAQMTYYRDGHAQVFDAGVINFGASADWPVVSTLMTNLWNRLA